jgi:hypothetical protein
LDDAVVGKGVAQFIGEQFAECISAGSRLSGNGKNRHPSSLFQSLNVF